MMWQNLGGTLPAIQDELGPDERVLWSGQPRPGVRLRAMDAFLIPFTIIWSVGMVYGMTQSVREGSDPVALIFLFIVIPIAAYIIVGRFFVDAWQRRKTWYAVTDQRVIIVTEAFGRKVRALSLRTFPEMTLRERRDGSGDLLFGPPDPYEMWTGAGWPGMGASRSARFEAIPDVRSVFNMIQEAQRKV